MESTFFGIIEEAIVAKFPHEQGELSSIANETCIKEGMEPQKMSTPSGATEPISYRRASTKRGKAIPPLVGRATGDGKGSWKTWWSIKPIRDLLCELAS